MFLVPVAFIDPPQILNASITPIPAVSALPLQVVANLGPKCAYEIHYVDTTGDAIGLFTGPSGFEELRCVIGGGVVGKASVVIAAQSRVSLRSMTSNPITNGLLTCTFMGV